MVIVFITLFAIAQLKNAPGMRQGRVRLVGRSGPDSGHGIPEARQVLADIERVPIRGLIVDIEIFQSVYWGRVYPGAVVPGVAINEVVV